MSRIHPVLTRTASWTALIFILASCGNDTPDGGVSTGDTLAVIGEITATVTCEDCVRDDSVFIEVTDPTVTMVLAKGGCCCPGDTCMARVEIPMGDHRIRVLVADSLRITSGGSDGGLDTAGYYSETGLVQDPDSATEITVSEVDSTAEVMIAVD